MTFNQIKRVHRLVDAAKMFFSFMLVMILLKNDPFCNLGYQNSRFYVYSKKCIQ